MGRPGGDRRHRRPPAGREPRPQRPAPRALARHPRRLGRALIGGRQLRRGARDRDPQGRPAGRPPVRGRPREGARPRRPRGRDGGGAPQAVPRLARDPHPASRRPAGLQARRAGPGVAAHAPARLRLHPGGPAPADRAAHPRRRRAQRLDGQRPLAGGALRALPLPLLLLQAALRAGHEPGDRLRARAHGDEPDDSDRPPRRAPARGGGHPAGRRARPPDPHRPQPGAAAQRPAPGAPRDHAGRDVVARRGRRTDSRPRSAGSAARRATRSRTAPAS